MMNERIKNLKLSDGNLVGDCQVSDDRTVIVTIETDKTSTNLADFSDILSFAELFIKKLITEKLTIIKNELSNELTDAAYSDLDYQPDAEDRLNLFNELNILSINFYPEHIISIVFEAKNEYPDMLIYCQLDEELNIEDISVN